MGKSSPINSLKFIKHVKGELNNLFQQVFFSNDRIHSVAIGQMATDQELPNPLTPKTPGLSVCLKSAFDLTRDPENA